MKQTPAGDRRTGIATGSERSSSSFWTLWSSAGACGSVEFRGCGRHREVAAVCMRRGGPGLVWLGGWSERARRWQDASIKTIAVQDACVGDAERERPWLRRERNTFEGGLEVTGQGRRGPRAKQTSPCSFSGEPCPFGTASTLSGPQSSHFLIAPGQMPNARSCCRDRDPMNCLATSPNLTPVLPN